MCVCARGGGGGKEVGGSKEWSAEVSKTVAGTGRRGDGEERENGENERRTKRASGSAVVGEGRGEEVVEGNNWRRRRRQRKRNRGGGGGVAYPTLHT